MPTGKIRSYTKRALAAGFHFGFRLLICFLFCQTAYGADTKKNEPDRDFIYRRSNIYIVLHPGFSPKPVITSFENAYGYDVRLKGVMNFDFGAMYMYNFSKHIGLSAGVYFAKTSFKSLKFNYTIPQEIADKLNFMPAPCFKCGLNINHNTTFPFHFIYRQEIAKKIDMEASVGLDLKLQPSFYYESDQVITLNGSDTAMIKTFTISLENEKNKNFTVIPYFFGSLGVNQLLPNRHYINYRFTANIPFFNPYRNGSFYILPGTSYEAHGTYKLNPMFFGIEVNYIFTFKKRKLKKEARSRNFNEHRETDNSDNL